MPELPEVETVRVGLSRTVVGRTIASVDSLHPRAIRRHLAGPDDLARRLTGRTITSAERRGKYLWLPLDDGPECLIGHLGMSGQLLVLPPELPDGPHLRGRLRFTDGGTELRFVDQRTFGGLHTDELVPDPPTTVPSGIAHIARDPLDSHFDDEGWITSARKRNTTIKRLLLDQGSISGVGNIYADEALWRAKLHGDRPVNKLSRCCVPCWPNCARCSPRRCGPAAPRSIRHTSTSTARVATSSVRSMPTGDTANRARAAAVRSPG